MRGPSWRVLAIALLILFGGPSARASHANSLWRVVHGLCLRDRRLIGVAAPCAYVDLKKGYAVVDDPNGRTQVLLVPTRRLWGIESPELQRADSPNYWQYAWDSRSYFERRAGRSVPRDDIGMAINSIYGRSQNQLHIHIDCVRRDVRQVLIARQDEIGDRWRSLGFDLAGIRFRARRLEGADLGASDPFKLLYQADATARADMRLETLAVIGATFVDGRVGFILLSARATGAEEASTAAENVLDHHCDVLKNDS